MSSKRNKKEGTNAKKKSVAAVFLAAIALLFISSLNHDEYEYKTHSRRNERQWQGKYYLNHEQIITTITLPRAERGFLPVTRTPLLHSTRYIRYLHPRLPLTLNVAAKTFRMPFTQKHVQLGQHSRRNYPKGGSIYRPVDLLTLATVVRRLLVSLWSLERFPRRSPEMFL